MSIEIMERMRAAFRSEALELLTELDTALLALEAEPGNGEYVHRVFRAIHTVKGSGATAGFVHLASVAHEVEEAFDLARSGRLPITAGLIDCGLRAADVMRAILGADDPEAECGGERDVARMVAELLPQPGSEADKSVAPSASHDGQAARSAFEVTLRPHRDLFYSGTDPITLLDELRDLGQAHVTAHTEDVPLFSELEPESCYLWWDIRLVTDRGQAAIAGVFTFVEDECEISIGLLDDQSSTVALLGSIPGESLELFAIECEEHLQAMEAHALELESGPARRDSLDALFRAVHSMKGNAGVLLGQAPASVAAGQHPLPVFSRIAHAVESLLDPHRQKGAGPVSADTAGLILEARDAMQALLQAITGRSACFIAPPHLLERLGLRSDASVDAAGDAATSAFRNTATQCLEVFENCLRQFGRGESGGALFKAYHRGLKTLASAAAYYKRSDLEEPVAAQLRILDAAMQAGAGLSPDSRRQLDDSFQATRARITAIPVATENTARTAAPARSAASAATASNATIRIDQEKLDRLMRVVGELLVAKAAFPTLVERISAGEDRVVLTRAVKDTGVNISHIAEELQASVMAIRMLPVKTVFQRFPRLVRDLAHSLGKEVQLKLEGETVELDKTILDQIGDPLVHLVRNAVDHGLESAEQRRQAGKPSAGRLVLRASNEAGSVCIQVEDDGRGLDSEALKRKAVEKGLLTPEAAASMSHFEACRLVFLPGLSTAEKVTEVSGRGVGMDVVRNNIRDLQGTIDISSAPGAGAVFSIKLPTSLIISKGILLEAGGQEYILPLTAIRDMVKVPATMVHEYSGRRITQVRGEVYSLFSLADIFGLQAAGSGELSVAVIDSGKVRYGLIADRFLSEVEVLVKPLAGGLEQCKEFHGAAIMGDGRVVLVLNALECHRLKATEGNAPGEQ